MNNLSFLTHLKTNGPLGSKDQFHVFLIFFIAIYVVELFVFWPGVIRPDSLTQLQQAQTGVFSDHHPPIMALYWGFLNSIYPGPGLMFLTHMSLLFGATLLFASFFKDSRWCWFYLFIPIWPQISFYSSFVLKDVGFTFSFLFVCSILTFYSLHQKKLPIRLALPICGLLFYGTAVKFQAAFVLPCLSLWLAYSLNAYRFSFTVLFQSLLFFCLLLGSVQFFNHHMTHKKDHSWQFVKLYDLAGISLKKNEDLFPDFVKNKPFFSMTALARKFNSQRVDELVFDAEPLLIKGKTEQQRNSLWYTWLEAIQNYPGSYFLHRWELFQHLLRKSPIKSMSEIASHQEFIPSLIRDILLRCEAHGLTVFFKTITSFGFYLPFMMLYLVLGLVCIKRDPYAIPLVFLNSTGLTLLLVLFVFSMASDVRYIYLTMCCFHFSHPFFFKTFKNFIEKDQIYWIFKKRKITTA